MDKIGFMNGGTGGGGGGNDHLGLANWPESVDSSTSFNGHSPDRSERKG